MSIFRRFLVFLGLNSRLQTFNKHKIKFNIINFKQIGFNSIFFYLESKKTGLKADYTEKSFISFLGIHF